MSYIKCNYILIISSLLSIGLIACQSDAKIEKEFDCSVPDTMTTTVKPSNKPWKMTRASGDMAIEFLCSRSPFVGDFQKCSLQLTNKGVGRFANAIFIDGGMEMHGGHGLPTVPTLTAKSQDGHYDLEGLKYSMPGDWSVGFKVRIGDVTEQMVFDFTI